MKGIYRAFIILLVFPFSALATHNKAGEITFQFLSGYTYRITITTYTDSGAVADRPRLYLNFGDGTADSIARANGTPDAGGIPFGVQVGNKTKMNKYITDHTYPGMGTYKIWLEDQNRVQDIINIPNSVATPFYIETVLLIDPSMGPPNSSPLLDNPPIDIACLHQIFLHNPWAWDPDGDSLSFELDSSRGVLGTTPYDYFIPSGISMNTISGDFIWPYPDQIGLFNFAFRVFEWRNGMKVGYVTRDMLVIVQPCTNKPPQIVAPPDTCIMAGDSVEFLIYATDVDSDMIDIEAGGQTFYLPVSPATFTIDSMTAGYSSGFYKWKTTCDHIRDQAYPVYLKAVDNSFYHLVDFATFFIRVIAPAPQNASAHPSGSTIVLDWDPSSCAGAIGYQVYRKNGNYPDTIPCPCETGVPAYTGFSLIGSVEGEFNTTYTDNDGGPGLIHGNEYCYFIVAVFADGALSCASAQVCTTLIKDVPVMTNVDIEVTGNSTGKVNVAWSKPTEIDSIANPPPYSYKLYRSLDSGSVYTQVAALFSLDDTLFTDMVNTITQPLFYKVELRNVLPSDPDHFIGVSHPASSVFLSITPTDNTLILDWNEEVPWTNRQYDIFRKNDQTGLFDSIGTTTESIFSDQNLANGVSYCYMVKSNGSYSSDGFIDPILNRSQEVCEIPIDNIPPCPPTLSVSPDCKEFRNFLSWNNPNLSCSDEVTGYRIYYTPELGGPFRLYAEITGAGEIQFTHSDMFETSSGCYKVVAIDSAPVFNESPGAKMVCVDNCPDYSLPNIFTPNGDGSNDLFVPFPYRYIQSIDLRIFDRWGSEVFRSENPDILWDGLHAKSQKPCSDGVYFYTCRVNARGLYGIKPFDLHGFFHIVNSGENSPAK